MDIFVGRSKQFEAIDRLFDREKGVALVAGETGVGKSRFLAEVYNKYLPKADFLAAQHVCKFSDSEPDPFVSLLTGLVFEAVVKQGHQAGKEAGLFAKTGLALERLGRTLDFGYELGKRLLGELNIKLGPLEIKAEKLFNMTSEALERFTETKPSLASARWMLSEHPPPFVERYTEIVGALGQDLPGMRLLLILDQAERLETATVNLLLDFIEAEMEGVYLVMAFKEEVNANAGQTQRMYQSLLDLESNVMRRNGCVLKLPGLTWEEIGDWIEKTHGRRLPDIDLKRIEKASGGLPLLVEEFLGREDLSLENLRALSKREYLNHYYEHRLRQLKHDTLDFCYRLSVLREPLSLEDYAMLVELGWGKNTLSECDYLRRQLEERLVFGKDGWFRHETIKDYAEERMPSSLRRAYHLLAAKLFDLRRKESLQAEHSRGSWINLLLSQDYHLRRAGEGGQGLLTNQELFEQIVFDASWDSQSLEDILGRVTLLERLYDYSQYVGDKFLEAEVLWWLGKLEVYQSWLHSSRTGFWDAARLLYDRSLGLARSLGYRQLIAENLSSLALLEWNHKNYVAAIPLMKQSLEYLPKPHACISLEQIQETERIVRCLSNLSELEYLTGDIRAASRHCKRYLRLIVKVKNAEADWDRAHLSFLTFPYAYEIVDGLCLLGQLYEARKENRKAVIVYGLLGKCYPDFRRYKGDKTVTELLNHLKGKVGQRRFKRYMNEVPELGFVADKNLAAPTYQVLDIVSDTLLRTG